MPSAVTQPVTYHLLSVKVRVLMSVLGHAEMEVITFVGI